MKFLLVIFCAFILFFSFTQFVFSLDWISIHEKADKISFSDALDYSGEGLDTVEELYLTALVYLNVHKDKEAGEAFSKMLTKVPKSVEARWGLAEVMRRNQQIEESERELKELLKINPRFWPAHITLAYVKYTKQEFNEAVKIAARVSKVDREDIDLSNLTRSFLIIGGAKGIIASRGGPISKVINGTQVLPNLKRAEKLQPDSAAVAFGLGSYYFLAPLIAGGNRQKAKEYLEKAIESDPLFADAYVRLAQLNKMLGEEDKARSYLKKALEIDQDNTLVQDFKSGRCNFACISVEE